MTRGDMVGEIKHWLGLQTTGDYDETPLIQSKIYRGTIDLLSRTRCTARCVHLQVQGGVDTYFLDHNIISLVDIEDGARRRARRDQVTVTQPIFTLIRSDLLRVEPMPTDDGELDVWGVLLPQEMDADTDSPGDEAYGAIPEEYQDAIVLYALWQMSDYGDDQGARQGENYRIQYEGQNGFGGRIQQIKMLVNKRGTARAPARRVTLTNAGDRADWI